MTNAIMNLQDLRASLAAKLQDQRSSLPPPSSARIRPVAKEGFKLPDETIVEELEGIVVDVRYINALYLKPFKRGEIETPTCWVVSPDANGMAPDEKSSKPRCESCEGCPMNEFGSKGAGKACKNTIRLAIVPPDADAKTTPFMLDLAPTSTTSFLKVLRTLKVPMQTVVMTFSLDSKVEYVKVNTQLLSPAPDSVAPFLMGLIDKAQASISRGYDFGD
jgi:hypothetical protein